ncbi:MAG: HAMP domain-containing protein [Deltaproteobacteria bacterium]|nr:HAMP domain-containing protein [Deltaproteobacteria bacterium]
MKFSIRLKLIAFTLCVVLLVGGSISLYFIYQGRQRIFTTFEKDARDITAVISGTIVNDLYFLDLRSLRRRLESARVNPEISYTLVTDSEGVVLTDGTEENALRDQKLTDPFSQEILLSGGWISRVEGEMLKVGGPVLTPDGSLIGYLHVGFSLGEAYKTVRETTRTSLYITLVCLGIGALLAVILSISFSRPILSMVQASREIGEGKLDTRLPIQRGDELGTLAESINQMAESLQMRQVEAKQAEEALKAGYQELLTLKEISQIILSSLDLKTVLESILNKAISSGCFDMGNIRLLNRNDEALEVVASRGYRDPKNIRMHREIARDATSGQFLFREMHFRQPRVEENVPECDGLRTLKREGVQSAIVVPIRAEEEILGIIQLGSRTARKFQPNEVNLLEAIGSQMGIAVQKARLYEQTKQQTFELEKSNKVKDEFLGFVSHELRTPVNAVIGYTAMIQDRMLGEITQKQEKTLGKVISRSKDLLDMINGLLEATRIEAGAVKVENHEVSLGHFLDELRSGYDAPLGKELSLNWDYPSELPAIRTDSAKLKHILQNLINNAIKYTDQGHVSISAKIREEGSRQQAEGSRRVEFQVADTGIGISKEALPVIFEMFQQGEGSKNGRRGGVGLGLHIVKRFTEMLGGRIEVKSEPGKGSTFTVTIPEIQR